MVRPLACASCAEELRETGTEIPGRAAAGTGNGARSDVPKEREEGEKEGTGEGEEGGEKREIG